MSTVLFPVGLLVDDSGTPLTSAAVVTIASVLNPTTGASVATPGATLQLSCLPNVSLLYDAIAHGEAWITLAVSQPGRTISGANAAPSFYCASDSNADWAATLLDGLGTPQISYGDALLIAQAYFSGHYTVVRSTVSPWTVTLTFYRNDGTTPLSQQVTTYTDNTFSKATSRAAPTFSGLPW